MIRYKYKYQYKYQYKYNNQLIQSDLEIVQTLLDYLKMH